MLVRKDVREKKIDYGMYKNVYFMVFNHMSNMDHSQHTQPVKQFL
jgi:hypothetical protein